MRTHLHFVAAVLLWVTAAQAQSENDLRETGFDARNETFAVKCDSAEIACVSRELGGFETVALRAYATTMADAAAAADRWLSKLGFSNSDLKILDGRRLIVLDTNAREGSAGHVVYEDSGEAWMYLPTRSATKVFFPGDGDIGGIPATMNRATLEKLGDMPFRIDSLYFNYNFGHLVAHELLHTRLEGDDDVHWLEEAMASAVGNAWGVKAGYGEKPGRKPSMRLNRPFDDPEKDVRGFSRGYGKAPFFLYVGEESGSPDRVAYLSAFRVPKDSRDGKLRDRDGGMGYLYDSFVMPGSLTFPNSFPRFVASRNQIILRSPTEKTYIWNPLDTDEDLFFSRIYRPLIAQARSVTKLHEFDRSVARLAADPIHLEDTMLRFDPRDREHERLSLAKIAIKSKDPGADLRLVFEHRLVEGPEHVYLTVADGRFDAGYVRVVNAPQRLADAKSQDYTLKVTFAPAEITVPECIEVGETVTIDFDGFKPEEVDNLRFEVSNNATLDGTEITATAPGPLRVTAIIEPHRTRAPAATASIQPYDWPDRRVALAPSHIVPAGGCRCTAESVMALSNPQMWKMNDAFSAAIGAGPISGPLQEMLMGSLGLGGSLPAGHSTGHLRLRMGAHDAQGSVCVDPLLKTQRGGYTVVSLYTPSVPTLMGSYDTFAVAHAGWAGWPANATAAAAIVIRATPDELQAGRSYQAELAGLQSTGFFPLYSEYQGQFYDFIPWQEAFIGRSLSIRPQRVAGVVRIESVERGVVEGTLRLAGTGAEIAVEHWLREGTRDTFEHRGNETPMQINLTGRFSAAISDRENSMLRAADFFDTATREK